MAKKKAEEEATAEETKEKVTKSDAVRAALKEGVDKPQDAVEWIKTKYGIEITPQHFSSYKSQIKKQEGTGGGVGGGNGQRRGHRSNAEATATITGGAGVNNGSPAELARAVKSLVERHGAGAVKEMVDVFGE